MSSGSKKQKVFVAMSGGVDSSVAALILKNEGHDVTGVHMLCADSASLKSYRGIEHPDTQSVVGAGICAQAQEDRRDAMRVAAKLGIPFLVWGFKKEYKEAVFNYMTREYAVGRTPNPDVMCNKEIKFGIFLKKALEASADFIATGHYVRLEPEFPISSDKVESPRQSRDNFQFPNNENSLKIKNYKLKIAKDFAKDQSYFLWTLTQDQLKHCLFPIGDYLKSEVREIAEKAGLPTADKKDSQGLCFVGQVDFNEFIKNYLPKKSGEVFDSSGKKIGEHDGAHFYTIGQRHGLNLGGQAQPVFVAQKDAITNTLVMARKDEQILYKKELLAENFNWFSRKALDLPLRCLARIRYRQPLQDCAVFEGGRIVFDLPQRAVASGQSIVFYSGNEMLGGGIIK